jgi:hypothetical protein
MLCTLGHGLTSWLITTSENANSFSLPFILYVKRESVSSEIGEYSDRVRPFFITLSISDMVAE